MENTNFFMVGNYIFDLGLKPRDVAVFLYLIRLCNNSDGAFPSYRTIARNTNMSVRNAQYAVKFLFDTKLILKQIRKSTKEEMNNKLDGIDVKSPEYQKVKYESLNKSNAYIINIDLTDEGSAKSAQLVIEKEYIKLKKERVVQNLHNSSANNAPPSSANNAPYKELLSYKEQFIKNNIVNSTASVVSDDTEATPEVKSKYINIYDYKTSNPYYCASKLNILDKYINLERVKADTMHYKIKAIKEKEYLIDDLLEEYKNNYGDLTIEYFIDNIEAIIKKLDVPF